MIDPRAINPDGSQESYDIFAKERAQFAVFAFTAVSAFIGLFLNWGFGIWWIAVWIVGIFVICLYALPFIVIEYKLKLAGRDLAALIPFSFATIGSGFVAYYGLWYLANWMYK